MSAGKILVVGLAVAGVAALALSSKNANASTFPDGWTPPAGAALSFIPANTLPGVGEVAVYSWPAQSAGGPPAHVVLMFLKSDPRHTFAAMQLSDGAQPGLLAVGDNPLSMTLFQAVLTGNLRPTLDH